MKKYSIAFALLSAVLSLRAQGIDPWQSLVDAENSFAQISKEKSMKEAFLANLNDASIVFTNGQPVKGRELWSKREATKFYLFWWPVVADIASSGELGYTTGPAEWGGEIGNPKPTGGGYYATVWKKDEQGVWKIATDLGSAKLVAEDRELKLARPKSQKGKAATKTTATELLELDKSYNEKLNAEKKSFFSEYVASDARIHRPGERPFTTPEKIKENIKIEQGVKFQFGQSGGDIAVSGDMGYSYGTSTFTLQQDGKEVSSNSNYLRVWKRENGSWKIVLDVIGR